MNKICDLRAVATHFQIAGEFRSATPCGSGHIHDTFCTVFAAHEGTVRYILQRINQNVFINPPALMENVERVTQHLAARVAHEPDPGRRALTLVRSRDGRAWHRDAAGHYWRMTHFIERAQTLDAAGTPQQVFEVARAFGFFQKILADLPGPPLHEVIPDFHHTPKRFAALEETIEADAANRCAQAKAEIEFALARAPITRGLLDADLPERIIHNDTKLNNVMLDELTGEAICVIDLDTVMPGLAPCDFGDLVRTTISPAAEDERDLAKVQLQFPMFEAAARGYLEGAGDLLSNDEKRHLAFAAKLITFETGIRFLADFLAGDPYFKVQRDGQNLDRCRTQLRLVQSMEQHEERMNRMVEELW